MRLPILKTSLAGMFDEILLKDRMGLLKEEAGLYLWPPVNILEKDENFTIELVAPGREKDDFKIKFDHPVLSVSYEKEKKDEEEIKYLDKEFKYTSFKRSFVMPDIVDIENISASYVNGVLKLNVPKKEEAKPKPVRQIEVL